MTHSAAGFHLLERITGDTAVATLRVNFIDTAVATIRVDFGMQTDQDPRVFVVSSARKVESKEELCHVH